MAAVVLVLGPALWAESGVIAGTTVDPHGAAISGAKLSLVNAGGTKVAESSTDSSGVAPGSEVTGQPEGSSEESLFPLQAALGYSVAQNLFITKKNVLVEGPADFLLLQHMSALLEQSGKSGLAEGVFVPVGGLDKLATFIALLGANKLKIAVLHDRSASPHQGLERLIQQKLIQRKRVLDYSIFRTPGNQETDIEDLFPEALYVVAFNMAYAKELRGARLTVADLGRHPRIVERINQWLHAKSIAVLKEGSFNHYRVAQALLPRLTVSTLSTADLQRFENLL